MFDQRLRPTGERLVSPLANGPLKSVSPLLITGFGLLLGLGAAGSAAMGWWWVAFALWIANRVADGADGVVARNSGRTSDLGGYLDLCADFLVYATLTLGVVAGSVGRPGNPDASTLWTIGALTLAGFYLNTISWTALAAIIARRGGTSERTTLVMPIGLVEGYETMVAFGAMLAFPDLMPEIMGTLAFATFVGAGMRIWSAAKALQTTVDVTAS